MESRHTTSLKLEFGNFDDNEVKYIKNKLSVNLVIGADLVS